MLRAAFSYALYPLVFGGGTFLLVTLVGEGVPYWYVGPPLLVAAALTVTASAAPVTLTYWQYEFASKVSTMNDLIKKFEAANPDIKIKQETFPYDAYNQKVASSVPAGQGPDVVNLFYGWLPQYVDGGFLQPLPEKDFPTAKIESTFVPMIKTSKINGKYYALPTAVRTLAVFYNKDMLK